ncbi:trypsin domain-containing protein [Phthorimaea operculella]|nr:trypsin domain-containing protein [Phthorimaea operculella]
MKQERDYNQDETRRVFGGEVASLQEYPAVAAILDRYWVTRCSGSVIKPFWVLTAAHCVNSRAAYIRYNADDPSSKAGDTAHVLYTYKHPNFRVKEEDDGGGMDVTVLHHDLGLIRTRERMTLRTPIQPLESMGQYRPNDLRNHEVTILGFGKTTDANAGENLYSVKLQMGNCHRKSWLNCFCGSAIGKEQRGVCSGDSGGPVIYNGVQVGVTSMGPVECVSFRSALPEEATSVFTSTFPYKSLIKNTIHTAEKQIELKRLKKSSDDASATSEVRADMPLVLFSMFVIILLYVS